PDGSADGSDPGAQAQDEAKGDAQAGAPPQDAGDPGAQPQEGAQPGDGAQAKGDENPQDRAGSAAAEEDAARNGAGAEAAPGDPGQEAGLAQGEPHEGDGAPPGASARAPSAKEQETKQWMARLPDDPGGLLRARIRRDYLRKQRARAHGEQP